MLEKTRNIEYLRNYPLSRLVILVHPYSEGYDETYDRRSDEIYQVAERLYSPINTSEFLLLIFNKEVGENSKQMDLLRRLRNRSMIPDNVQVGNDIVGANQGYDEIDAELAKYGKKVNQETEIILGGERTDQCVESLARRILRNPDILELKISRMASLYSDLDKPAEASSWRPNILGTRVTTQGGYFVINKI